MSTRADNTRKRMHEIFRLRHSPARVSRDTAHGDCLREIQEDVVLLSPKVYESGIITRLDLRLVDLYGDCAIESADATPTAVVHESAY
ncbi:MAG: hypothetical protein ACYDAR_12085 [Thermomicrobiales bacterium]